MALHRSRNQAGVQQYAIDPTSGLSAGMNSKALKTLHCYRVDITSLAVAGSCRRARHERKAQAMTRMGIGGGPHATVRRVRSETFSLCALGMSSVVGIGGVTSVPQPTSALLRGPTYCVHRCSQSTWTFPRVADGNNLSDPLPPTNGSSLSEPSTHVDQGSGCGSSDR